MNLAETYFHAGNRRLPRLVSSFFAMVVLITAFITPTWADTVTVDLEYRTDTLAWELYALVVDTGSGADGSNGLAAVRALIDNVNLGINMAGGIGAIDPIAAGMPNERPPAVMTSGGTLDVIYGQDISTAGSVVGGVGVGSRTFIVGGTFADAMTPPAFGDDDFARTTDGNFLDTAVPGPFSLALPWDDATLNVMNVTPGGGLACDLDADGDCDHADIDLLYVGSPTPADISTWLADASAPSNPYKADPADTYVVGDANLDGDVDSADLGLLLNNFSSTAGVGWGGGDLNADSNVNSSDLGLLLNNFSFSSSSAAAVPEPTGIPYGVVFVVFCLVRRRA